MKTLRWMAILALVAPMGCDQAGFSGPEASLLQEDLAVSETFQEEAAIPLGGQDDPYAVDRNENGCVCGATEEGPYIDDVRPPRKIKIHPNPNPNPNPNPPFLLYGCMSPAYPVVFHLPAGF